MNKSSSPKCCCTSHRKLDLIVDIEIMATGMLMLLPVRDTSVSPFLLTLVGKGDCTSLTKRVRQSCPM